ncbi:MAG: entericidin A/B family lipoprotein [Pseudomonadota bacterium]
MFALAILPALAGLTACNTVKGVGKDIEKGGEAVQKGAQSVEDQL